MREFKFCSNTDFEIPKFQLGDRQYETALKNGMKYFKFYSDKKSYVDKLNENKILKLIHNCMCNVYNLQKVIVDFHTAMKMERCNEIYNMYDIDDFYESLGYLVVFYHTIYIKHNKNAIDECMIDILQECYEAVTKVYPILLTKYNIKF